MKKTFFTFLFVFMTSSIVLAAKPDVPKYDGYRPLSSFAQDTVRYLQYNWGLNTGGVHQETHLSDFFETFELPISDVEIRCSRPGGIAEVGYVRFWLIPYSEIQLLLKTRREEVCRYCLHVDSILPTLKDHSMLYEDLQPYIPNLDRDGITVVPWKDEYKKALGPFLVNALYYCYGFLQ